MPNPPHSKTDTPLIDRLNYIHNNGEFSIDKLNGYNLKDQTINFFDKNISIHQGIHTLISSFIEDNNLNAKYPPERTTTNTMLSPISDSDFNDLIMGMQQIAITTSAATSYRYYSKHESPSDDKLKNGNLRNPSMKSKIDLLAKDTLIAGIGVALMTNPIGATFVGGAMALYGVVRALDHASESNDIQDHADSDKERQGFVSHPSTWHPGKSLWAEALNTLTSFTDKPLFKNWPDAHPFFLKAKTNEHVRKALDIHNVNNDEYLKQIGIGSLESLFESTVNEASTTTNDIQNPSQSSKKHNAAVILGLHTSPP